MANLNTVTLDVAQLDKLAKSLGLPLYSDLVNSFCDLMDGQAHYDLQSDTGLPQSNCDRIASTHSATSPVWLRLNNLG